MNMLVANFIGDDARPVINSSRQIILLVVPPQHTQRGKQAVDHSLFAEVLASIMGAIEGLVFGSLDAEDDVYLRNQFQEANSVTRQPHRNCHTEC